MKANQITSLKVALPGTEQVRKKTSKHDEKSKLSRVADEESLEEQNKHRLDCSQYAEFIVKARNLAIGHVIDPIKAKKKEQRAAKAELRMYLRNIGADDIDEDTHYFGRKFYVDLGLKFFDELEAIYKNDENETTKNNVLRMLLSYSGGCYSSMVKILEKRNKDPNFKHCVKFLKSFNEEDLRTFIYKSAIHLQPKDSSNLAKSFLDITDAPVVVDIFMQSIQRLLDNREMNKEAKEQFLKSTQRVLLEVIHLSKALGCDLETFRTIYRTSLDNGTRIKTALLMEKYFPDNAGEVLWEIANDSNGFPGNTRCNQKKWIEVRKDALQHYAMHMEKDGIENLRNFVLTSNEPELIKGASEVLLRGNVCGKLGKKALVDALDESVRSEGAPISLAALISSKKEKEEILRVLFSKDIDMERVYRDIAEMDVADPESNQTLISERFSELVDRTGLHSIVNWMNSGNRILRRNATNIFMHANDKEIKLLLSSRSVHGIILKKLAGINVVEGNIDHKNISTRALDSKQYGALITRIRHLNKCIEANEPLTEGRLNVLKQDAMKALNNTLEELAKDDSGISLEASLLDDIFKGVGLKLNDELLTRLNRTDQREITERKVIFKMLLCLKEGFSAVMEIYIQKGNGNTFYEPSVEVLKSLNDEELKTFIYGLFENHDFGWEKINNLTGALLETGKSKLIISTLLQKAHELRRDTELDGGKRSAQWKRLQRLLITVMEKAPPEDLDLSCISDFYKMASSYKIRQKTEELLIARFERETIPLFLDVMKDTRGIKIPDIIHDKTDITTVNRQRRMSALNAYVSIADDKEALSELRNLLLNEKDPFIADKTCDWFLTQDRFGEIGKRAVVDVIDEHIRSGIRSLPLAFLSTFVQYKEYRKDILPVLKHLFSSDFDLVSAFKNLDNAWLCKIEDDVVRPEIHKPGAKKLVKDLGLGRLTLWMDSKNETIKRNAIKVFNLADNNDISEFAKRETDDRAQLFRKLLGIEELGQKAGQKY